MQSARLWARLLGLQKVVVEGVEFDEDEEWVLLRGPSGPGATAFKLSETLREGTSDPPSLLADS